MMVGVPSFLPPSPLPFLACRFSGVWATTGSVGDSQGVFISNSHLSILPSVTQQLCGVYCPREPPVPILLLDLILPLHLDPPSPSFPGPRPLPRTPVPSQSHLPLACSRLLANTSLLRPLATLHRLPCCFLLGLCFPTTKNLS